MEFLGGFIHGKKERFFFSSWGVGIGGAGGGGGCGVVNLVDGRQSGGEWRRGEERRGEK